MDTKTITAQLTDATIETYRTQLRMAETASRAKDEHIRRLENTIRDRDLVILELRELLDGKRRPMKPFVGDGEAW